VTKFRIFAFIGAIIAAGIALAACGGSSTALSTSTSSSGFSLFGTTTTSGPASSTTAAPPTSTSTTSATKPAVNYGQQFLTDVAPWNAATANLNSSDGLTSQAVLTAASEAVVAARSLLGQSWPTTAEADVHAFAVELDTINEDVREDDATKFRSDVTTLDADANVVRADLGLPSIK
jgi:hypothetical protein